MRLDKYLVANNIGSRSQVKSDIKKGLVRVNGNLIKNPDSHINEEKDVVVWKSNKINYEPFVYYILHKPAGIVSAVTDNIDTTVVDLLKKEGRKDLFPVGRLDKDTEGFLIITNDGTLAHNLLSPKKHVAKTYYAKIDNLITKSMVTDFENGIDIGDEKLTLPAKLEILNTTPKESEVLITITEGRYHQIKRMFQVYNGKVIYLKRISMGGLSLPEALVKGTYYKITKEELERGLQSC